MSSELKKLFKDHINTLQTGLDRTLDRHDFDGLLIGAGPEVLHFEDDMGSLHKANPHFRHWCPLPGPDHVLALEGGKVPKLFLVDSQSFWDSSLDFDTDDFWVDAFEIEVCRSAKEITEKISKIGGRMAFHGPNPSSEMAKHTQPVPEPMLAALNWRRSLKTPYEIRCFEEATKKSVGAHRAAKLAFHDGGSELSCYLAYTAAAGCMPESLPYGSIVAINRNAAVLHHQHLNTQEPDQSFNLLVDAGVSVRGYGTDITRTTASSYANSDFVDLLKSFESLQLRLCSEVQVGTVWNTFKDRSKHVVAEILLEQQLVKGLSAEAIVAEGICQTFYPHSIGHQLGVQVHDVGGNLLNELGERVDGSDSKKASRIVEPGMLFTVEPGLYFIESLLQEKRASKLASHFNWQKIDSLVDYGGIRIEDNLVVGDEKVRNLTREVFDF